MKMKSSTFKEEF